VDPTGASIVGAALIAKDTERGTVYTVRSNGVGVFNLPRVPVGTYELKAGAPGFQTAVYHSITLVLNQTARVDFQLKLGRYGVRGRHLGRNVATPTQPTQHGYRCPHQMLICHCSRNYTN
jgi:hypothetical protein